MPCLQARAALSEALAAEIALAWNETPQRGTRPSSVSLRRDYPLWLRRTCQPKAQALDRPPLAAAAGTGGEARPASAPRGSCRRWAGGVDRQADWSKSKPIWESRLSELERLQKGGRHSLAAARVCWRKNRTPWPASNAALCQRIGGPTLAHVFRRLARASLAYDAPAADSGKPWWAPWQRGGLLPSSCSAPCRVSSSLPPCGWPWPRCWRKAYDGSLPPGV